MITTHAAGGWGLNQPPDRPDAEAPAVEFVGRDRSESDREDHTDEAESPLQTSLAAPSPDSDSPRPNNPVLREFQRAFGLTPSPKKILRAYNPISWFHRRGILRVVSRLKKRLPDVGGSLFLTFTVNPALFATEAAAFEHARAHLRRVFFELRKGVEWQGKHYEINAPYCVKVEFHQSGWAHFHAVFLTRRYVPGALLSELWGLGRTDVRRISNHDFHYLLKYVTKGGELPEWVLDRKRLRVFQTSPGFYREEPKSEEAPKPAEPRIPFRVRKSSTIRERIHRWSRTALYGYGPDKWDQIALRAPFSELFDELVYSVALAGRYLGGGQIQINDEKELEEWIQQRIPQPQP